MLSRIVRNINIFGIVTKPSVSYPITSIKKVIPRPNNFKNVYKTLAADGTTDPKQQKMGLNYQTDHHRINKFDEQIFQIAKELMYVFSPSEVPKNKKSNEIKKVMQKVLKDLTKEGQALNSIQLLNLVETIKIQALKRIQSIEDIDIVYTELSKFMNMPQNQKALDSIKVAVWSKNTLIQYKIRSIVFLSFLTPEQRSSQLKRMIPYMKYFKSIEIMVLLYEKWRFNYEFSYEVIDQLHLNDCFSVTEDINQSFFKMLFLQTIKGQFSPPDENIFTKVFYAVIDKQTIISHTSFRKLISFIHVQAQYAQSEGARATVQSCFNFFCKIAKNKNYQKTEIDIKEIIQIYLGFQNTHSIGQVLLSELTYYSKTSPFQIADRDLPIFQKLFRAVVKNIAPKLQYQFKDGLNKEYTNDTLNFLRQYLPKYLKVWPEVIFLLKNAVFQLQNLQESLFKTDINAAFKSTIKSNKDKWNLRNPKYLIDALEFIILFGERANCKLQSSKYELILDQILELKEFSEQNIVILEIFYNLMRIIEKDNELSGLNEKINSIFGQVIMPWIQKHVNNNNQPKSINHLDDSIVWLSLCVSKANTFDFTLDQAIIQIFINQKLNYMINSLSYLHVYEILKFTLQLSRLRTDIYEKLLVNLSTFIISQEQKKKPNSFFLNYKYSDYYEKICRLVFENKERIKKINNKNATKILQLIFFNQIQKFNNNDLLMLMQIISDPLFLCPSLIEHIQGTKFTSNELLTYQNSPEIKFFQYYNKSILKFYQGRYNESQIKNKLNLSVMGKRQIQDLFSRLEVYKTIILSGQLNIRFEIPEPETDVIDFKYMYICQKIYQKIKSFNDFGFNPTEKYEQVKNYRKVDLGNEFQYITRQNLIPTEQLNSFRVKDKQMPKYLKMEVWKTNIFVKKNHRLERKDIFFNNKRLADQILINVIKGVSGNSQRIKETLKQFNPNDQLINALKQAGIQFEQYGALIEVKSKEAKDAKGDSMNIICTSNTNVKILTICAYMLSQKTSNVIVIKQNQSIQPLVGLIKKKFMTLKQQNPNKQLQEEETIVQQ